MDKRSNEKMKTKVLKIKHFKCKKDIKMFKQKVKDWMKDNKTNE